MNKIQNMKTNNMFFYIKFGYDSKYCTEKYKLLLEKKDYEDFQI